MQPPLYLDDADGPTAERLYQRHAPGIFTYLRLHTPVREEAEDLLVETFLAALENERFIVLSEEEQRLWLWRVARNKVVDYYRAATKRNRAVALEAVADELFLDEEQAPEILAERSEEYLRLRKHIGGLPRLQQQILQLRFVDGLRCHEIARRVGKREGAVRMLLSRTLTLLRSIYEKH